MPKSNELEVIDSPIFKDVRERLSESRTRRFRNTIVDLPQFVQKITEHFLAALRDNSVTFDDGVEALDEASRMLRAAGTGDMCKVASAAFNLGRVMTKIEVRPFEPAVWAEREARRNRSKGPAAAAKIAEANRVWLLKKYEELKRPGTTMKAICTEIEAAASKENRRVKNSTIRKAVKKREQARGAG